MYPALDHMSTAHCWFTGPAHLHLSSCRRQWASIQAPHFCFSCHSSHSHISESVSAQGKHSVASCALRINSEVCSMASRMPPDMAPVFLQPVFCLPLSCPLSVPATLTFLILLLALALARPWVPSSDHPMFGCISSFWFSFKCHLLRQVSPHHPIKCLPW